MVSNKASQKGCDFENAEATFIQRFSGNSSAKLATKIALCTLRFEHVTIFWICEFSWDAKVSNGVRVLCGDLGFVRRPSSLTPHTSTILPLFNFSSCFDFLKTVTKPRVACLETKNEMKRNAKRPEYCVKVFFCN